jgi:E3 ubiquitin-protein ligase DOA10
MGFFGDLAGAVGSAAGGFLGQAWGQHAANKTNISINDSRNALNWQMFKDAQKFNESQANTAHQRQVDDLRKAGLNPILSVNSGAPSASIAPGSAEGTTVGNVMEGAASTALGAYRAKLENKRTKKDIKVGDSQAKKNEAESALAEAAKRERNAAEKNIRTQQEQAKLQLDFWKNNPNAFKALMYGKAAGSIVTPVTSAIGAAAGARFGSGGIMKPRVPKKK